MNLTIRTHYNPCFWTAYWNFEYKKRKLKNYEHQEDVRRLKIYCLNLKGDKILSTITNEVFYKKNLGLIPIEKLVNLPGINYKLMDDYEENGTVFDNNDSQFIWDFENFFTNMEDSYRYLLEKFINEDFQITDRDKAELSFFILYQTLRHPNCLSQLQKTFEIDGYDKADLFNGIVNSITSSENLQKLIMPFCMPTWIIYKIQENTFPLSDNPILIDNQRLMVALAPNILLEFDMKENISKIHPCIIKSSITQNKIDEFFERMLASFTNEIVFGEKEILNKIKNSNKYLEKKNAC